LSVFDDEAENPQDEIKPEDAPVSLDEIYVEDKED